MKHLCGNSTGLLGWDDLSLLWNRGLFLDLSSVLDILDHHESLKHFFLVLSVHFSLKVFLNLNLLKDQTCDVTALNLWLSALIIFSLKIDEAFHLLVESLDFDVNLEVKVWDGALLNHFDDINVTLNAGFEIYNLVLHFLLFDLG
jgi:hypothetical protein